MKGITLWEPWASLVAAGVKAHETRSWSTRYRGPLLIHAAKRYDESQSLAFATANIRLEAAGRPRLLLPLPRGHVVAFVYLVDCKPTRFLGKVQARDDLDLAFGDWSEGRWAWELADVQPLPEPIVCSGSRGLWVATPELRQLVNEALDTFIPVPGDAAGGEVGGG